MLSPEGKKIRGYWKPNEKVHHEHQKKIKETLKHHGLEDFSISAFLYDRKYHKEHARIANALKAVGEHLTMAQTITLTGIADSTVDQVVGDFQSEGATVTKTKQADGTWTVVAKFT